MFVYIKWKKLFISNSINNNTIKNFNNVNSKNNNDTAFHVFSSIISSIEIILSCLIFSTTIFYKKKLSRIDLLVIAKNIFYTFIFSLFLFFSVEKQIYDVDENYNYSTSKVACFNIAFLFGLQIAINIEQFKSIRNPCYVIKYMINNRYNISKHSITSLIISFIITVIPYFFQNETKNLYNYIFNLTEDDYFDITISKNKILSPAILFFSFFLYILYRKTKLFYFNLKGKSLIHLKYANNCLLLSNILYFVFAIFLIFSTLIPFSNISKIIHVMFYIISILDSYIYLFKMFHSGFYFYYLNKTFMGFVFYCLCFGFCLSNYSFPKYSSGSISSLTTKHTKSIYNFYSYLDYIVEDYILETLDFILYSITAGLSIVYKDLQDKNYTFRSKNDFLSIEFETQNLSGDNNKSDKKDDGYKNIFKINEVSDSDDNNEDEDLSNSSTYNFFRVCSKNLLDDKLENDLFSFSNCGDANITITPLFVKESNESMTLYQINKLEVRNSLLSHKFLSLLMTNSKKIFFKQLNNLIIKTYDNKLLIELHTDINIDDSDTLNLINKYYNHINYSNINSFLCILIGVFRIKINNLKEILIFVSRNPFIENVPRNYYNYWELMRFNIHKKTFNKILSSKDADSFIIFSNSDSLLSLTRNNNLFQLEDFPFFQETIKNDIKFLKSINSCNFCLLVLYYEFEYNRNISKDSIFSKIRIKLINESNSNSDLFKSKKINLSAFNFSSSNNTDDNNNIISPYKNLNGNLFDEADKEVFLNPENKKKIDDEASDIPPLVSNEPKNLIMKNAFESSYNNYKGILYFRWENVFCQKKNIKTRFYFNYVEEVLKYFSGK